MNSDNNHGWTLKEMNVTYRKPNFTSKNFKEMALLHHPRRSVWQAMFEKWSAETWQQ